MEGPDLTPNDQPEMLNPTLNNIPPNSQPNITNTYNWGDKNNFHHVYHQHATNGSKKQQTSNLVYQTYNGFGYLQEQVHREKGQYSVTNGFSNSAMLSGEDKFKNRYSFKRLTPAKPKTLLQVQQTQVSGFEIKEERSINHSVGVEKQQTTTFYTKKIKQLQSKIRQQDLLLTRIRQIAYNRKKECERNLDKDYACLSTLIQIYNISITHTTITPLPSIIVNVGESRIINNITNIQSTYIPTPINIVISPPPPRPNIHIVQPPITPIPRSKSPEVIPYPHIVTPPRPLPPPIIVPPQPKPIVIPPTVTPIPLQPAKPVQPTVTPAKPDPIIIDNSEIYIKEIHELNIKISKLQEEIRQYERQRFEMTTTQQTIKIYREQIERLKQKILILSVPVTPPAPTPIYIKDEKQIQQLKSQISIYISKQQEYEYQLIEAQNHIIYLENLTKSPPPSAYSQQHQESEIKRLRQTIAYYTEQFENIQHEKQEFRKYIVIKEEEIHRLYQEINTLNIYIQENKPTQSAIDPNQLHSLVAEYGKKILQVIILFSEIERLKQENLVIKGYLEKAQEYIMSMQVQQGEQTNENSKQLQLALEQQYKKQICLKNTYQIEIHRLTTIINELSKQVTIYETEISSYKVEITNINITLNELKQQISIYQTEINQFKQQVVRINNINLQLTQQITVYQTEISNYVTQINQFNHQKPTVQGVDPEVYNALVVDYGKKSLQVIILLQQINRLNASRLQVLQHLKQAEEYIMGAQEHIRILEEKLNRPVKTENVQHYILQIRKLQTKLVVLTQQITIYESKQATHLKQVQALQLKYKELLALSDKKYQELLAQKNSLVAKITILNQRITTITNTNITIQKSLQLHQINKKLNIQIAQITQLLVNSQTYIKTNTEKWEKIQIIERQLTEQTSVIEILNREIQLTKNQNTLLNDRIIELQKLVEEFNSTTTTITNSQNMTIVIREKEEVEVLEGDRHAQIQQLELSLAKYTTLYNEAQKQIQGYKEEIKKFNELEGYLKKTEVFVTEQELKWNTNVKNYESANSQLRLQLTGAEDHIKGLEQQLSKLNTDFIKIQEQNQLHMKENHEIRDALDRAEKHIFEMEKLIHGGKK